MAVDKKKSPEQSPEIIPLDEEKEEGFFPEQTDKEKYNPPKEDLEELKQKILKTPADDGKEEIEKETKLLELLTEENKIKKLLAMAKHKDNGVVYAIKVAQTLNDPFVLDKLHDSLIEKGYYKNQAFSPTTKTEDLTHKSTVKPKSNYKKGKRFGV